MSRRGVTTFRIVMAVVAVVVLVCFSLLAMPRLRRWWTGADPSRGFAGEPRSADKAPVELAGVDTVRLTPGVIESLGVRTGVARNVTQGQTLELSGSLAPDTNRLVPIRSRFAGEVIEIGTTRDPETSGPTRFRTVDSGDKVVEGQLLAVVWCKDLGEKKSELVDALSQMKLDEDTLKRLREVDRQGAIPAQQIAQAQRSLETDRIAVRRAESTLRTWRLTEKEIKGIYQEAEQVAERVLKGDKARDPSREEQWARVEVRAPFDGTLLEKNFSKGAIVDTSTNLFILGDLTKLSAFAYAYEEDLPALKSLPAPVPWTIRLKAEPRAKPFRGNIREIRPTLDPTMHAALVRGQVDNPEGRLVSGQFITADIQMPPPADEVEVPITALIEDGRESIVFIQADPTDNRFTMRRVAVARRTRDTAYLRKAAPGSSADTGLQPGTRVVTAGALELQAALLERKAAKEAQNGAQAAKK